MIRFIRDVLRRSNRLVRGLSTGREYVLVGRLIKSTQNQRLKRLLQSYKDKEFDTARFHLIYKLYYRGRYVEDLLGTMANVDFLQDARFCNAYEAGKAVSKWGRDIRWRVYNLIKFAGVALSRKGDFIECGVDRGGMALALHHYYGNLLANERKFYLFDTFQGLIEKQMNEAERKSSVFLKDAYSQRYPDVYQQVKDTFSAYPNVKIIRGAVPESLVGFNGNAVAFLHLDMNCAYPEVKALEFFWPYIQRGGVVLLDDYGFPAHEEQKKALDELVLQLGSEIILLPTGQGLVVK